MKRRGFLLNSAVIVLLIPLLLLLATYEDVSSSIIKAQSEKSQFERTYNVITFLNLEFQRALELSGKRAVVAAVDYVAVTGNFISPIYMANNTIRDFIKQGTSPGALGYDTLRVMGNQTIKTWLSNVSKLLQDQGYRISPSIDDIVNSMEITVAPLDAFTVAIRARIPSIKITDSSGLVVYSGPIPSNGGYVYSTVDIRGLEDPVFSAMTGGRYHRSLRACPYAYPTLGLSPITAANGTGIGTDSTVLGYFGRDFRYNLTDIWDSNGDHISNLTINGLPATTKDVILNDGDTGVLKFGNASFGGGSGGSSTWCSALGYRINVTIENQGGNTLTDFQVPIYIDSTHVSNLNTLNEFFDTADSDGDNIPVLEVYDANCNPIYFWVEKWDTANREAIIWVNVTIPAYSRITLGIYFGSTGTETLGDPDKVFDFYDDFSGATLNTSKWEQYNARVSISNGVLKITNAYAGIYTKRTFSPPVIIEFRQNIKNRWAELYIAVRQNNYPYAWGPLWWVRANWIQPASWAYLDDHDWGPFSDVIVNLPTGWHEGTIYWFRYNSVLEWDTGEIIYNPFNRYQDYSGAIALGTWDRNQEWDWIRVRKYSPTPPRISVSTQIEQKPQPNTTSSQTSARVYNIQPLINCLLDQLYVATENGWSFFERLEGSNANHNAYVTLSHQMQDEMGYKYGSQYYPIGLVSFMIPDPNYDRKLFNLFLTLGISVEEGQSSTDYYFLNYYFGDGTKAQGYRVWGISEGILSLGDLSNIPFFIDPETSEAILGSQGTCDLLYGYTCP